MTAVRLSHWAAWSPGIETEQQWREWATDPRPLQGTGAPAVRFLPALTRRRCDQLSRMALQVAGECCPEELLAEATSVFASRHGAFGTMLSLLESLADELPLSPARFSHSVHNAPAGLFSIWAGNQQASTCVAAAADTFAHGFLEAVSLLRREPGRPVLFVTADEAIPEPLMGISDHNHGAYAVALLLSEGGEGEQLEFGMEPAAGDTAKATISDALEFLRWFLSGKALLRVSHSTHTWVWRRTSAMNPASLGTRGTC